MSNSVKIQKINNTAQKIVSVLNGNQGMMLLMLINATDGEMIKLYQDNSDQLRPFYQINQQNSILITDDNQIYICAFNLDKIQSVIARFDVSILGSTLNGKWSKVIGSQHQSHQFLSIYLDENDGVIKLNASTGQFQWLHGFEYNKTILEDVKISSMTQFYAVVNDNIDPIYTTKIYLLKISFNSSKSVEIVEQILYFQDFKKLYHAKIRDDFLIVFSGQAYIKGRTSFVNSNDENQSCYKAVQIEGQEDSQYNVAVTSEYLIKEYNYQNIFKDGGIMLLEQQEDTLKYVNLKEYYQEYPKFCNKKSKISLNYTQWDLNLTQEDPQDYRLNLNELVKGDENCLDSKRFFTVNQEELTNKYYFENDYLIFKYEDRVMGNGNLFKIYITYPDQQQENWPLRINLLSCKNAYNLTNIFYNLYSDPVIIDLKPQYQKPHRQCPDPYFEFVQTEQPTSDFYDPFNFDNEKMIDTIYSNNLNSRGKYIRKYIFYFDSLKKDIVYQLVLHLTVRCNSTKIQIDVLYYKYYVGNGPIIIDYVRDKFWSSCRPLFEAKPLNLYSFITFDNITNSYIISDQSNYSFFDDYYKDWRQFTFDIDVDLKDESSVQYY
ncbi:UNKNOWN [Stylonychia lemnae]|uniref:Uncharacterized protein n=1 Tax=Stylonychia lemnae TaxID=5949 RepID=A0A078BAI2_STYLE|nr:UNKNOWN [Stylonychia lemnae]|eukprot:CDW91236.1 UNKNOWN [Stylonychia lemnae]